MWAMQVVGLVAVTCCACAFSEQQQVGQEGVIWNQQQENTIPDTPPYVKYADNLFDRVQERLTTDINLKIGIRMVNMKVENVTAEQVTQEQTNEDGLAELQQKFETIDRKLEEALAKITAMENALQEKTERLATSQDIDRLVSVLDEIRLSTATKTELEELLDSNSRKVQEAVTEAREACKSDAKLTKPAGSSTCPSGKFLLPYDVPGYLRPDPSVKGYTCSGHAWIAQQHSVGKTDCRLVLRLNTEFAGYDIGRFRNNVMDYKAAMAQCTDFNCIGMICQGRTDPEVVPTRCWMKYETHLTTSRSPTYDANLQYWYAECGTPTN